MTHEAYIRDKLLRSLTHIDSVFDTVHASTGRGGPLSFPDEQKLVDGLLMSAWAQWERFTREVFITDFSRDANTIVQKRVSRFRSSWAAWYLAEAILDHPDEDKWVEWSSPDALTERAKELLSPGHRYSALGPYKQNLRYIRTTRNAVAHRSDVAWNKFKKMAQAPPFNLSSGQMRGLTTGRFLASHQWRARPILKQSVQFLSDAARALVP